MKWEDHIEAVSFPPKKAKTQALKLETTPNPTPQTTNTLMEMMILQQQQRSEFMQTALLACLSNSPTFQVSLEISKYKSWIHLF